MVPASLSQPPVPYAIVRRRDIEPWDWLVMAGTVMLIWYWLYPTRSLQSVHESNGNGLGCASS